jgi:DNA-binding protein H-NS
MARPNGKLSEKQVSTWFAEMAFDKQRAFLGSLNETHHSAKQVQIDSLRRQLAELEGGRRSVGGKRARKPVRGKTRAAVKYRDPKSGATWSGRGRMARWLADKVSAGEKPEKYLA